MLFSLLNRAAQGDIRLLLSGSNAPAGLEVRADVRTRIGAGLVFHVQPLSDDDKVGACGHANERASTCPTMSPSICCAMVVGLAFADGSARCADRYSLEVSDR